jgi:hypothetical protein
MKAFKISSACALGHEWSSDGYLDDAQNVGMIVNPSHRAQTMKPITVMNCFRYHCFQGFVMAVEH